VTYFWYYNNGDVNMVFKVQIYIHSFVKRLTTFISDSVDLSFSLNLHFWCNALVFLKHEFNIYVNNSRLRAGFINFECWNKRPIRPDS